MAGSRKAPWLSLLLALGVAGCRGCSGAAQDVAPEASGPTMPVGMLTPLPDAAPPAPPGSPADRLSMARGKKGGEWAELQIARPGESPERTSFERGQPDSRFLSLDAMTLLHHPFARALPGFDLFLPRRFDGAALGRLRVELAAMKAQVEAIPNVAAAKERWGEASALLAALPDDTAWLDARGALVRTIDDLSALADDVERQGGSLWVLGI